MTWFIARNTNNNKVRSINDENGMGEIYSAIDRGWTIYRIEPAANGRFTLVPQQLANVTTTPATTGGDLEDAP